MISKERKAARAALRFGFIPNDDDVPAIEEVARESGRGYGVTTGDALADADIEKSDALSQAVRVLGRERFDALWEEGYQWGRENPLDPAP